MRGSWDHPRLRGNHYDLALLPTLLQGSPPLTREPLAYHTKTVPSCGITPAYAGTTSGAAGITSREKDHPRLRGNHLDEKVADISALGSPPLTREPRSILPLGSPHGRITPAYAGTTIFWTFADVKW